MQQSFGSLRRQRSMPRPLSSTGTPSRAEDFLYHLYRYRYLTLAQLLYCLDLSPTLHNYIRTQIKLLLTSKFVHAQYLSRKTPRGSLPMVYTLGAKGYVHLKKQGFAVPSRVSDTERYREEPHLLHNLELNTLLLSALALTRADPTLQLVEWRHDWQLQQHPTLLPEEQGKKISVTPDGFLDFYLTAFPPEKNRKSFILELDRGTEDMWQIKEKIRQYSLFADGPYQRDFSSTTLTILWATTAGTSRVQQLRRWTIEALTTHDQLLYADLHRFCATPALFSGWPIPQVLFTAPVWYTLENDTPVAVIAVP